MRRPPIALASAALVVRRRNAGDLPFERRLHRRNSLMGGVAAGDRWRESGGAAPLPPTLR